MKQKENSKRVCEKRKTIGIMQFGRKAPTPAEIKRQAKERQKYAEEIRQRFTTAKCLTTEDCDC